MKTKIIIAIIIVAFISISSKGIENNEKVECYKWQKQAEEIQYYWLTEWQADQCEAHNIKVGRK